jgi:peptidoglycan/xylan/chitin deacetylase (PgdA/CDA1 family)
MKKKASHKKGKKTQKSWPFKQLCLCVGVLVFLAAVACGIAWATGYEPSFMKQYFVASKQSVRAGPVPVPKPQPTVKSQVTASPLTIAVPKVQHDYQFPPIQQDMAPITSRIPTKEKVVFLTIDDGIVTNPKDAQLMQTEHVKATFFLVHRFISTDWNFFSDLAQQTGSDIQNHSYDHYQLPGKSYDFQKQDICNNADAFLQWFGKRPNLFRPSGGGYDATTQKAAADCGMRAIILWDATVNNGVVRYQRGSMQPGDIVLMHFRSTFAEDLTAFAKAAKAAGLQPELLVDWAN